MKTSDYDNFPKIALVKQNLFKSKMGNLHGAVKSALKSKPFLRQTKPGQSVAVAAGSRGISRIDEILIYTIEFLKAGGLKPFIVPAMGSHGGATDRGQQKVLEKLGITEKSMGVPIFPEMDVVCLGELPGNVKIFFSKKALEADHIIVVNRIKPHTKFSADIESGLCKIMTIGLGKAEGAAEFHRKAVNHSFTIIEDAAGMILAKCRVLFGLGILEDGYGNTAYIDTLMPSELIQCEKQLLKKAVSIMGRIPFDHIDILVVDYIGKNISGIGMDSNVTGRHRDIVGDFYQYPHIKRIFVRDLTSLTDGNGNGIGLADFTTTRLVNALDIEKMNINALTAISPEKAAIPIHFETDKQALKACVSTAGLENMESARLIRIKDTAHLEFLQVSSVFDKEISENLDIKQISPWEPIQFNKDGNLSGWGR